MNDFIDKPFTGDTIWLVPAAPINDRPSDGVAFLLAQIGHHAAGMFGELMEEVGLTPPHSGILRAIATEPGRSQQALSAELGLLPSRVVAYVDELEEGGYVERRRNPDDRRLHALHLTASGKRLMGKIGDLARQHERRLTTGLTAAQRATLRQLLTTIAERQGLTPHVHPGFRTLGRERAQRATPAG